MYKAYRALTTAPGIQHILKYADNLVVISSAHELRPPYHTSILNCTFLAFLVSFKHLIVLAN